jgi:hypothetical protein
MTPAADKKIPADTGADPGPLGPAGVRILKIAVVVMGLVILAGLATVVARIVYLAKQPARQTVAAQGQPAPSPGRSGELRLPAGAVVRHLSLSGDRLAVHFDSPAGSAIAVIDAASGAEVSRIELKPEVPRR